MRVMLSGCDEKVVLTLYFDCFSPNLNTEDLSILIDIWLPWLKGRLCLLPVELEILCDLVQHDLIEKVYFVL